MKKHPASSIFSISFIIITLLLIKHSSQSPPAFTIIRNIPPSVSFQDFLSSISRPTFNSTSNSQIGYNLISIAGFSQISTLQTIQNSYNPLMLWKNIYSIVLANKGNIYGATNQQIQKYIVDKIFHRNGSKILMNIDLLKSSVSTVNAQNFAQQIVKTVSQLQFDGISIMFQDYHAVKDGSASLWLNRLLSSIRNTKPNIITVLIIPPTFVPKLSILRSSNINSLCNYYVLKYYNTIQPDYNSYKTLFQTSQYYSRTSILQLITRSQIRIDICRTMIAKPATQNSTWNTKQYINSNDLNLAFVQFYNKIGWFGGYANLNYQTDKNSNFVNGVLTGLRDLCERYDNCVC